MRLEGIIVGIDTYLRGSSLWEHFRIIHRNVGLVLSIKVNGWHIIIHS